MGLADFIPAARWLKGYSRRNAVADLLAGVILSVLLVPQAMAYALLAGLPPEAGLYTAILPPLIYMLLGTSNYASMGPVALASLLVADAIGASGLDAREAAAIIAVEVGALLIILGLLRLGRIVNFISDPALLGFTAAAAVLIAASQIPAILGIEIERSGNIVDTVAALWPKLGSFDGATLALGAGALVLLLVGDRYGGAALWKFGVHPPWRTALVKAVPLLVLMASAAVAAIWLSGVETVRRPPSGLPPITIPGFTHDSWLALLPSSGVIAIVIFVTGMAVAKSLAGRSRQDLDTSREAIAIGAASIGGALTGGYAPGVSLSRSALVFDSGGRTPLASGIAAIIVLVVALFFAAPLAYLPKAALAALVISAVFSLVKIRAMQATWRHSKSETLVIVMTLGTTLLLGVQWGLAAGAAACIAAFLWFSSLPRITRLGTREGGGYLRSVDREDVELDTLPVLAIRFDHSLYFGNVGHVEDRFLTHLSRHDDVQCLLIDMKGVNDVDYSGMAMLERLVEQVKEQDVRIAFAEVRDPVRDKLNVNHVLRGCNSYPTSSEGVEAMRKDCDTT
ncbi:MAG: SulP family inorganic anion transporter [Pacificimonas sp.]